MWSAFVPGRLGVTVKWLVFFVFFVCSIVSLACSSLITARRVWWLPRTDMQVLVKLYRKPSVRTVQYDGSPSAEAKRGLLPLKVPLSY
jgi:hypothetical protein